MVQTWRERLDSCVSLKDLYYTFCFLRDMGYKVDKADFKQAYKNRFEELKHEMSMANSNNNYSCDISPC